MGLDVLAGLGMYWTAYKRRNYKKHTTEIACSVHAQPESACSVGM
jgi:hypothetical protein